MSEFLLAPSSYLAIILVLVLAGSGLPVPEEVPVVAAGILAANNKLNPSAAFLCCLFGAIVGDCVMYWVGYHFGRSVLRDHRWWARFITPEREAQIEQKFRRHGLKVFFLARFLVGLRSPVYLTAGILRVSFRRFLLIDLVCATVVVGTFFGLTYVFGQHITQWVSHMGALLSIVVIGALACVGVYLWRRHRQRGDTTFSAELPTDAIETPILAPCRRGIPPHGRHGEAAPSYGTKRPDAASTTAPHERLQVEELT